MTVINANKLLVIDLYSGKYIEQHVGYEILNLIKNSIDDKFYGYCPPGCDIGIKKLGAKTNEQYVDNITVVYVRKEVNSNNREIIAFCLAARVFKQPQVDKRLNRQILDDNNVKTAPYFIMSDNLFDLGTHTKKFKIKIEEHKVRMFRRQRFFGGTYHELDKRIISYLENILKTKELFDIDDSKEQEIIQISEPASSQEIKDASMKGLYIVNGTHGPIISKDNRITKSVLIASKYKCAVNSMHETFITPKGVPFMEGHHLIPCTVINSKYFMERFKRNIDCFENIVCLCPNCHREIHYGEWKSKSKQIKALFKKQKNKLMDIGIDITEYELLNFYNDDAERS